MNRIFKLLIIFLLLIISLSGLYAKQEVWMDASFYADTEIIPTKFKELGYFDAYPSDAKAINRIGPAFSITYFPSDFIRVGLIASATTQFPVGYTTKNPIPLFSDNNGFLSYHFDYRQDFGIGIAYNQMLGNLFGLFMDASINMQLNRIASQNIKNNKNFDYYQFATTNLLARIGILCKSNDLYFKLGGSINYDLQNKAGINYALFAGCGLIL